ncbi:MAG: WD40 repeat protein, partial [Cognaticolwellia sp.]
GELLMLSHAGLETWSLPKGSSGYMVPGGVVSLNWHGTGLAMLSGNQAAFAPTAGGILRTPEGPTGNKAILVRSEGELLWGSLERIDSWRPGELPEELRRLPIRRLHSLPDGRIFVTSMQNTQILGPDLEQIPGTLLIGFMGLESAASAGGNHVAALGVKGRLVWFDSETQEFRELGEFPEAQAVAVAPAGWPLYLGDEQGVFALAENGARTRVLETSTRVVEIAVSDDGRLFAAVGTDRVIRVAELESGEVLGLLRGHTRNVAALDFSPDSSQLASGGWDDRVLIWDMAALEVDPEQALEEAESHWGLTPESALE